MGRRAAWSGTKGGGGRVWHLEVKDYGPYEAEGQLGVAVCNVIIPYIHQLDL